jgi:hypothetical protein
MAWPNIAARPTYSTRWRSRGVTLCDLCLGSGQEVSFRSVRLIDRLCHDQSVVRFSRNGRFRVDKRK